MSPKPFLGILLAIAASAALPLRPVEAATIAVTTTTDELNTDGDCSLREAVRAANSNAAVDACPAGQNAQTDTITVPAGTYTLTLAGNDNDAAVGDLDLLDNTAVDDLVITGAGAATTIIQACTGDQLSADCPAGQGVADRVLHLLDAHVAISGVTIRHGRAPNVGGTRVGSGIWIQRVNTPGALTLTDVVVTKNGDTVFQNDSDGGGIANWYGVLTLTRVIVSDNGANGGGGISNSFRDSFGGYSAVLVMTDSTVSGNTAGGGGGGILNKDQAVATLTGSTISGNHVVGGGGGGITSTGGAFTLINCTVSGNEAMNAAGGIFGGPLTLQSSTVTANRMLTAAQGAGGISASGTVVLRNSIVAGNFISNPHPTLNSPDCHGYAGSPVSEGFSLVGDGSKCPSLVNGQNGDQIGTAAAPIDGKLDLLADYGGPTRTHPPLPDSPAINAGNPAAPGSGGTACPTTDQRGETRPSGIACDVGAIEVSGAVVLDVDSVQPAVGGNAGTVELRVFGTGFVDGTVVKLVRAGFADVVGTTGEVHGSPLTSSLDLRGAAPGLWSVRVENPDSSVVTLADAFRVEAGGGADLWSELVLPRAFNSGRTQTIYLQFGNRGTVDARGVPLFLSFADELIWGAPFPVSPPPAQAGQQSTDWTRIAIDVPLPRPAGRDQLLFLLPIVPAGSTGTLRLRVKVPLGVDPSRVPIVVSGSIGGSYFHPDLGAEVVAEHVARAKAYAASAHGTTTFPPDAAIEQYVRTQLTNLVAEGTAKRAEIPGGDPPIYSLTQLLVDTGQFIAGESATASSPLSVHHWLAELADLVTGRPAFARLRVGNPDPNSPTDCALFGFCEDLPPPCEVNPELCESCETNPDLCDPPVKPLNCDYVSQFSDEYLFGPCKPKDDYVPYVFSFDPNDKVGPGGPGGFIDDVTPLPYTILFENKPTAAGDAFEVTVTDQLDTAKYDLATFQLGSISFGDRFVPVPPGLQSFSTEVDLRPGANIAVGIEAALDTATGIVRWKFTTLDPATHEFPEDPEEGFLPPNVTSPEGEGAVLFTVSLKPGFGLGTTVCNAAHIVFDFNAPIDTPGFCNTIGAPEDCENCVDDDGDTLVDRADPDCTAPANGAGAGVGDAAAGKAVDKCAKAIRKVGAKLTSTRLKQLGACEKAVADCVQLKPGDAACLAKAQEKCTKARTALPAAEAKLTAAIVKACGEPTVTAANLDAAAGLGFSGETSACAGRGVDTLATVTDVAECVRRQHQCAAERVLGAAVPRALELLQLGGFDPETDLRCLATGAYGGGSALDIEKRKAIRKCDAALQKAATKLLAGRTKASDACGAAVFTCLQTKPGDPACVGKAGGTCAKAVAGIPKLAAGFATTIEKACGASPLVAADLLASEGLGASALGARCAKLGVASLATVADVTACLEAQLTCHVDHLLESTTPRLGELLDLGGVALP